MNWTGGTLQRTKTANKGVIQKQKAYFAKARTLLQNEPDSPIAPFRPSYLQNDDGSQLGAHMPAFGSGSTRHTGHPARRHREAKDPEPVVESGKDLSRGNVKHPLKREWIAVRDRKEKERENHVERNDSDPELQLLEANKRRLLRQHDWIGVAASRPVNLRFSSGKEKAKVGRRRKVEGRHGAVSRRRDDAEFDMATMHHLNVPQTGTLQHNPGDIRVRIGTDALTTACSTQPEELNRSHASSEPMLFDQQTPDPGREDVRDTLFTGISNRFGAYNPGVSLSDRQTQTQRANACSPSPAANLNDCYDPGPLKIGDNQIHLDIQEELDAGSPRWDNGVSKPYVMQQIEGATYPFQLVFSDTFTQLGDARRGVSRPFAEVPDNEHAGASQIGTVHNYGHVRGRQFESEATAAIVDEQPWKSLLGIPKKSSSHTTMSSQRNKLIVQHQPTAQREHGGTNWSQHATEGNDMHSSSFISSSLPSLRRGSQRRAPILEDNSGNPATRGPEGQNKEEKEWKDFVFGSDKMSSSSTLAEYREGSAHGAWQGSSRYLPSIAVSPMRSTPFRTTPGHSPRTRFAPPGSRMINSPVAANAGSNEEMGDDDEDGDRMPGRSAFGEQSVTHASMQNNASGETELHSSRMFSNTGTSCNGLEHPGKGSESLFVCASASSSQTRRRVNRRPIYDLPDSDEDEYHAIDRGRL